MSPLTRCYSVNRITVIGAGLMGAGITQVAAASGYTVTMYDTNAAAIEKGKAIIHASLARLAKKSHPQPEDAKKYIEDVFSRIKTSSSPTVPAELVIEAIVENLEIKHKFWKQMDQAMDANTIFASNTSSLPIYKIAEAVSDERKKKFAGLHFFNPVPQMKLVEVIQAEKTSQETHETLLEVGKKMGRSPVTCKDTPGFIVNRLLVPYMMEAIRMAERGDATPKDIDTAMKLGAGYPMGPFELADYVGLDTTKFIVDGWYKSGKGLQGKDIVSPSESLDKLVKAGKLGRKSGAGFHDYESTKPKM